MPAIERAAAHVGGERAPGFERLVVALDRETLGELAEDGPRRHDVEDRQALDPVRMVERQAMPDPPAALPAALIVGPGGVTYTDAMPLDSAPSPKPAIIHSVCPHDCPSTCALDIELLAPGRIGIVHGAKENAYTAGVVCAKVARYAERVHHPDRLTRPLRRIGAKGEGKFAPIGWDEALDEIADQFQRASARFGSEAVWPYYYAGTMGLVQRDGINRLRHVMRYSRQHKTICSSLSEAGWKAGIGAKLSPSPVEIAQSDLIVVWGANLVHTQVNLMHHISRARKERGARLIVIDPYRNATAAVADQHIAIRPGTDGAFACAVMHVMLREGLADRAYMAELTDDPPDLERHLSTRTPDWAARITGVPEATIIAFARDYGRTKRAMIRIGYGLSRSRNGAAQLHAVSCLPAMSGAWRHAGGGAMCSHGDFFPLDRRLIEGTDRIEISVRNLDMSLIGRILTGDREALKGGPKVVALLIQNTNPLAVAPESTKVRAGFLRDDLFVCVHEQFMTDTARMADIVLPATTFLEHDDLYTAFGHAYLQIGPRAIDPLGEARSNHDVICALAHRLGARHEGFEMSAWQIIDSTLQASKLGTADELKERRWIDLQPGFADSHFLNGFATPDRKFHFAPDWRRVGADHAMMSALPDHLATIDEATEDRPFRLVTAPARNFLNSSFSETTTSRTREGRPQAKIHPEDCHALGLKAGDPVRIGNAQASVVVHAEPFAGMQRRIVVVEGVWPNGAFIEGIGINALTSADPGPPLGGAVFHDTSVWLRPA